LIPEVKPPFQIDSQSQAKMNQLDSRFKPMVQQFLEQAYNKGITLRLIQGYRSHEEQQSLYEQGRTKPGSVVTNAKPGVSLHNYGLAVDCVPMEDGKIIWNKPENFWDELGELAKSIGMIWGGDFSGLKDNDHFQYPVTYSDIVSGKFRPEKK
jgi:peptidoglycan L-alanyl-D-glutamate endopeptidase CwlK